MKQIFKKGSIERLLQIFIRENKDTIPQYKIQYEIGSGSFYDAFRELNLLGVIEREPCFDEAKKKEVVCVKLTEKGKKIIMLLKEMYEVLEHQ